MNSVTRGASVLENSMLLPQAEAGLEMVRKGGTVIRAGNWVDRGNTVPLNVMKHITSNNLHIHSVHYCGNVWGHILNIMQRHGDRFSFQ